MPTSLTVMGTEIWRERREEGVGGWWVEGEERCFLREEGREMKESLVAVGSTRYCWLRKESRPGIGAEIVVVMKKERRRTAAMTVVGDIIG